MIISKYPDGLLIGDSFEIEVTEANGPVSVAVASLIDRAYITDLTVTQPEEEGVLSSKAIISGNVASFAPNEHDITFDVTDGETTESVTLTTMKISTQLDNENLRLNQQTLNDNLVIISKQVKNTRNMIIASLATEAATLAALSAMIAHVNDEVNAVEAKVDAIIEILAAQQSIIG